MAGVKRTKSAKGPDLSVDKDILDVYHPNENVAGIVRTKPGPKIDVFKSFRPAPNTCLDYNISQTDTKLDAGDTKIHIQETRATYQFLEKPPPPPKPRRPISYFSGGPPQWEFVDEIWLRKQDELQKLYHVQFKERIAKIKLREKLKR